MVCENCGKDHDGYYGSGRFCSKECARSYSSKHIKNTELKEAKCISCGKTIYINKRASLLSCKCDDCKAKTFYCLVCNKQYKYVKGENTSKFCSKECKYEYKANRAKYLSVDALNNLSKGGRHSAIIQGDKKRSKNEIAFYNLCKNKFNNVTHNEQIFNGWDADILIYDIKFAILWNGKWHYEKITKTHSVKQVQNRDTIKVKEIINKGWTPYIIKDVGKYNISLVLDEFNKLLKYTTEQWSNSCVS